MSDDEQTPNLPRWTADADYTASSPLDNLRAAREAVRTSYHGQPYTQLVHPDVWDRCQALINRYGETDEVIAEVQKIAGWMGHYRSPLEEP